MRRNEFVVWGPRGWAMLAVILGVVAGASLLQGQVKQVGDVADDFVLTNVLTGEPFRLSDHEGSVVVLDFFSYW